MNRFKKHIAQLVAIPAAALAMVGWASTAQADDYYDGYSYSPYDTNHDGYLDAAERHEAQHDTNRNGRLDAWEHESLHRHDADARRSQVRRSRYYNEDLRRRYAQRRVRYVRPAPRYYNDGPYYYRAPVSFRWRIGW